MTRWAPAPASSVSLPFFSIAVLGQSTSLFQGDALGPSPDLRPQPPPSGSHMGPAVTNPLPLVFALEMSKPSDVYP